MNEEMSIGSPVLPCERWASPLAAQPGDLSTSVLAALDRHVATCPACAIVRAEYQRMDALIRGLPAPAGFSELPPRLAQALLTLEEGNQPRIFDDTSPNRDIRTERVSPMHPTSSPQPTVPTPRRRSVAALVGAAMAAVIVLAFAFTFLARSEVSVGTGSTGPGQRSTPVQTAIPLTTTSEQAAYLGEDGHLHEVTLNGAHDTTGPLLPSTDFISQRNNGWVDAAAAPNGHEIAYVTSTNSDTGGDGLVIVTVATGALRRVSVSATNIFWSPDGSRLAADAYQTFAMGDMGPIHLINPTSGAVTTIHATLDSQPADVYRIIGWLDTDHLAVIGGPTGATTLTMPPGQNTLSSTAELSGGPALQLDVLDVNTGALRHLVDLVSPPDVFVSPDGKMLFVAPSTWVSTGYAVDPTTGQVRYLPRISETFAGAFVNIDNAAFAKGGNWAATMAWQPGTHTIALSLGAWGPGNEGVQGPARQAAGIWLLNLDHDTAISVSRNTYPLAWTVDGASLLMSSLPASDLPFGGLSVGPTMTALSPVSREGTVKRLTDYMVVFFGLVQTTQ